MKKNKILKIVIVLIMSIAMFAISINAFAATDNALDGFWSDSSEEGFEDQGDKSDLGVEEPEQKEEQKEEPKETEQKKEEEKKQEEQKETEQKKETNKYNDAGLEENSVMIVAITILGIVAIYAYKKVNEYKNI